MINSKLMKKFISKSLVTLDGDWVIIGGTVLSIMGIDERVTMDIDMVGINVKDSNSQSVKPMEIAESLGLPVESINQAAGFFLSKIHDYEENLVLFSESKKCRIFRPNAYLFLKLKLARLSETDLLDCLTFVRYNLEEALALKRKILKMIKLKIKSVDANKESGLLELIEILK